jgi:hypothetical protein
MRAKKSVLRKLRQISLAEFAVLEMTNDPKAKSKVNRTEPVTVTSKEAYVWAALMAHVAENEPGIGATEIIRAALGRSPRPIKNHYRNFPYYVYGTETQTVSPQIAPDLLGSVVKTLGLKVTVPQLVQSASNSYRSLTKKGLIEDPVEILLAHGVVLAVLGMLPTGFTQKTKEGRTVSKKLKALYWTYEKSESRGVTTTEIELRLLKMIKAFRAGMVSGVKNALKEDEEEN